MNYFHISTVSLVMVLLIAKCEFLNLTNNLIQERKSLILGIHFGTI